MNKKILIYCILFVCLLFVLFLVLDIIKKNRLETQQGGEPNAMVKTFRSSYQFSGNVYVVHSEKGTILIDSGYYDSEIKEYIMKIGGLDAILLTH